MIRAAAGVLLLLLLSTEEEQNAPALSEALLEPFAWRSLGPANMGGRIVDLAVHPRKQRIFYVASATGGLFKTTNGGATFTAVFDQGGSASLGAVCLAPSDPEVVWVGTGEANARNSVSWGDGVYRSVDGGQTWSHAGLEKSLHVGRIAIHPEDASTVFVAALGSTWGPSPERGLYRTRDGGQTWQQVLFVDEDTGCMDVRIDPTEPDVVYAATYQRRRDEFDGNDPAVRTGPGSGLWRSLDGGDSFERLHHGLPTIDLGRIGIDLFGADPRILFAVIETARTGERGAPPRSEDRVSLGIRGSDHEGVFQVDELTAGESGAQAGLEKGDVILAVDAVEVTDRSSLVQAMKGFRPGDTADLTYTREGEQSTVALTFLGRLLRSRARSFAGSQGGQVADAQDEQGEDGFETGGVFRSEDRGTTWKRINSLNPRPFYYSQIRVDPVDQNYLYVLGIAFHASDDGGLSFRMRTGQGVHPDHHALWVNPQDPEHLILCNDGGLYVTLDRAASWDHVDTLPIGQFYNVAVDLRQPYRVYGGLQDNGSWSGPSASRTGSGTTNSDWIKIGGGDGFHCAVDQDNPNIVYSESQNGMITRLDLSTGEQSRISRPDRRAGATRFNWNTPFLLSPHNSSILYFAGNRVIRSLDRGESHELISPEVSRTEQGSATALSESPLEPGVLYVGTDDGALKLTRNGGHEWTDLYPNLPSVEAHLYVSDIETSRHASGRVFVSLDGHRSNDYAPHLYLSDDYGATFRPIDAGLAQQASVRTIVEDPDNQNLLFVGTETGCWVSIDRGAHWARFESQLPTVPVYDLVIHPSEADLVAATHGRGIWIADIAPLKELTPDLLVGEPHLFEVAAARLWNRLPGPETNGVRHHRGRNPARGAAIYYYLPEALEGGVQLTINDALGKALRELEGPGDAGLHLVRWDLSARRRPGPQGRGRPRGAGGGLVEIGDYAVTLVAGQTRRVTRVRVLPDPMHGDPLAPVTR